MPWSKLARNSSRSGITNLSFNQINHEPDNDKIHLYAKDPYEAKYHLLINKRESMGINKSFTWFLYLSAGGFDWLWSYLWELTLTHITLVL